MVLNIEINEFFKKINYKPSVDSDGAGDYINGVDDLVASKFNTRWNSNDAMLLEIQKYYNHINASLNSNKNIGFIHEQVASDPLYQIGVLPFDYIISGSNLDFIIKGLPSTFINNNSRKLTIPNGVFIDFIYPDDPQFSIIGGSSNLFEIQTDYEVGFTADRWYRLGHDGAEGSPEIIIVSHTLSPRAEYGVIEVIFEDYMNNPVIKHQKIRVLSTENNEYVSLILDSNETNYRFNFDLWTGSVINQNHNVDSGVLRTVGIHKMYIISKPVGVDVYLDSNLIVAHATYTMQYFDSITFNDENDSGSADYFDIHRYNVYEQNYFTLTAENRHYIYIDTDGVIKTTTVLATAGNKILYDVLIPIGATGITADMITDLRSQTKYHKNINLMANNINTNTITINENFVFINNAIELTSWLASQSNGDTLIIGGSFNYTTDVTFTAHNLKIISNNCEFQGNVTINGDNNDLVINTEGTLKTLTISSGAEGTIFRNSDIFTRIIGIAGLVADFKHIIVNESTKFINCKFTLEIGDSAFTSYSISLIHAIASIELIECYIYSECIQNASTLTYLIDYETADIKVIDCNLDFEGHSNANYSINIFKLGGTAFGAKCEFSRNLINLIDYADDLTMSLFLFTNGVFKFSENIIKSNNTYKLYTLLNSTAGGAGDYIFINNSGKYHIQFGVTSSVKYHKTKIQNNNITSFSFESTGEMHEFVITGNIFTANVTVPIGDIGIFANNICENVIINGNSVNLIGNYIADLTLNGNENTVGFNQYDSITDNGTGNIIANNNEY